MPPARETGSSPLTEVGGVHTGGSRPQTPGPDTERRLSLENFSSDLSAACTRRAGSGFACPG